MAYNPRQPRNPIGQWTSFKVGPGWHTYKGRSGQVNWYYVNDLNQMVDCENMLTYGSRGQVFSSVNAEPLERTHLMATEDEELMSVAATDHATVGVIYHDKTAPKDEFSLSRGSKFEPAPIHPDGETVFGGEPDQLTDRKDGRTYNTLNAQKAQDINRQAFEAENAKVFTLNPGEFAEKAVEVRHKYEDMLHISRQKAAKMPVYAYVKTNKDGRNELVMVPAVKGIDENGNLITRRSPNSHGGSPVVKLRLEDITRHTRSMQADGLDRMEFCISGGTNLSKKGRPLNNALHFRKNFDSPKNGQNVTVWGTIEQTNKGVEERPAGERFTRPDGTIDMEAKRASQARATERRRKAAKKYANPKTDEQATTLLQTRYANRNINDADVHVRKNGEIVYTKSPNMDAVFDSRGERIGFEAKTTEGFQKLYNHGREKKIPIQNIQRTTDGNYCITSRSRDEITDEVHETRHYFNRRGQTISGEWEDPKDPYTVCYYNEKGEIRYKSA